MGPPPGRNRKRWPYQGTVDFQGLSVRVENAAGDFRRGVSDDGTPWKTKMRVHYGEFVGTRGTDGDPVDCFIGPRRYAPFAYVVHARDRRTDTYDECKVMLGFSTRAEALAMYRAHYDGTGWVDGVRKLAVGELRAWLRDPRNRGRKIGGGQELRKAIPLPADLGRALWDAQEGDLTKGKAHKYIRRVRRNGRWVYFYKVTGGAGLGHHDEMHVGAKFRMPLTYSSNPENPVAGHWEVIGETKDGKIRVRHDESGAERTTTREQFSEALREHHRESIRDVGQRAHEEHVAASLYGSTRQRERAAERVRERFRQFPEMQRLLFIAPPAKEPKWRPKGHREHEHLKAAFRLCEKYIDNPRGQLGPADTEAWKPDDNARRAARLALKALEFYGHDFATATRLSKRAEALGIGSSKAFVERLQAIAAGDPSLNRTGRYYDVSAYAMRALFAFEHAKGELAIDRKEDLKGNVALYLDTLRHEARRNYIKGHGNRGGMEALRDILGQIRTKRGVKAFEDILAFTSSAKSGPGRRVRLAHDVLDHAIATAQGRLKSADREMERLGRSDLTSTSGRATPTLDAAIESDIQAVRIASGSLTGAHQEFGHVLVSADRRVHTENWESRVPDHRFSQLHPSNSMVQRAFRERFGASVHIEDAVFDTFNSPPRGPTPKSMEKRFKSLEKAAWGIHGMGEGAAEWATNADKAAAAEVRMASEMSTEMRADALRSVWTALEDMEKSTGPIDLSGLPIVISDRFVGTGAAAHYNGTHTAAELGADKLVNVDVEPKNRDYHNENAVRVKPHIALGLRADKSLGHELAHYIENRLTIRPGGQDAVHDALASAGFEWAHANDPFFFEPENRESWAKEKHDPGMPKAILGMLRRAKHVGGLVSEAQDAGFAGGGKYLSTIVARILHWRAKADKPAYHGDGSAEIASLADGMLAKLRKLPGGREVIDLQEAIQSTGAYQRFEEMDKEDNRGNRGIIDELFGRKDAASRRYWESGTEMTARAVEQYLYEAGAARGEVNTTLTHPHYSGEPVLERSSAYFDPHEFNKKIAPKVKALLASMGEHMTKALLGGER